MFGYRLYSKLPPFVLFIVVGVLAATGLSLSATGKSLVVLYLTYGVLFGGANGLGYGYALQLAGQAAPTKRGLAMGLVTAFYAVGATIAPKVLVFLIATAGNALALQSVGVLVLFVSLLAAGLLKVSGYQFESEGAASKVALSHRLSRTRLWLWVAYGALIAIYPVAVANVFGAVASPRIYGQIFTAWGLAGLVGPWLSGWLFDVTQSYSIALILAAILSCVSAVAIRMTVLD